MKHIFWRLLFIVTILIWSAVYLFAQPVSKSDYKDIADLTIKLAIQEHLIDGSGKYSNNVPDGFYEKFRDEYDRMFAYNTKDVLIGSLEGITAGISEGFYETSNYYPNSKNYPEWLMKYLRWDINNDEIFCKVLTAKKVFRDLNYQTSYFATERLRRFYGGSYILAYLHNFIVKSTAASIVRSQAKYGKPFHDFNLDLFIPNSLFRELGF